MAFHLRSRSYHPRRPRFARGTIAAQLEPWRFLQPWAARIFTTESSSDSAHRYRRAGVHRLSCNPSRVDSRACQQLGPGVGRSFRACQLRRSRQRCRVSSATCWRALKDPPTSRSGSLVVPPQVEALSGQPVHPRPRVRMTRQLAGQRCRASPSMSVTAGGEHPPVAVGTCPPRRAGARPACSSAACPLSASIMSPMSATSDRPSPSGVTQ